MLLGASLAPVGAEELWMHVHEPTQSWQPAQDAPSPPLPAWPWCHGDTPMAAGGHCPPTAGPAAPRAGLRVPVGSGAVPVACGPWPAAVAVPGGCARLPPAAWARPACPSSGGPLEMKCSYWGILFAHFSRVDTKGFANASWAANFLSDPHCGRVTPARISRQ